MIEYQEDVECPSCGKVATIYYPADRDFKCSACGRGGLWDTPAGAGESLPLWWYWADENYSNGFELVDCTSVFKTRDMRLYWQNKKDCCETRFIANVPSEICTHDQMQEWLVEISESNGAPPDGWQLLLQVDA